MTQTTRRGFAQTIAGACCAAVLHGQAAEPWAGDRIVDCHHHMRPTPEANIAHLDGCRDLQRPLPRARQLGGAGSGGPAAVSGTHPRDGLPATDITKPTAEELLTNAVKSGASGFGELKFHVEAAGPELRRMYALAGELNVPILIHFQEVPHTPTEGVFATGFKDFAAMLKAYPKTKFIGHADAFWANVSADYANEDAYPTGPIKRGGVTDKLLARLPEPVRRSRPRTRGTTRCHGIQSSRPAS